MKRLITLIAIGFALAIPAQASAYTTKQMTAIVKKGFTRQIRARLTLAGLKFVSDTVKCASVGGQHWTCFATYTATKQGAFAKWGLYINASALGWKTVSNNATLIKEW